MIRFGIRARACLFRNSSSEGALVGAGPKVEATSLLAVTGVGSGSVRIAAAEDKNSESAIIDFIATVACKDHKNVRSIRL